MEQCFFFQLSTSAKLGSSMMGVVLSLWLWVLFHRYLWLQFNFFWHPSYGVFLQITYLAMTFEYMATILAMVFWDGRLIGYKFFGIVANMFIQW